MGWGRWGGYYGGYRPSKKASAASLSTATLQRVLAQKQAEEEASVRYQLQYQQRLREAQAKAEEEARLELEHGGKEGLAKWRADNAEHLQAERLAKMEAERKAAGEQAVVNEVAGLRVELASLPPPRSRAPVCARFQLNKAQTKASFRLTDKDIDSLPKITATSGRSKTLYDSADIFAAVLRKEGKKQLRHYQAAYNPDLGARRPHPCSCGPLHLWTSLHLRICASDPTARPTARAPANAARRVVEEELAVLEQSYQGTELLERGRKQVAWALALLLSPCGVSVGGGGYPWEGSGRAARNAPRPAPPPLRCI